MEKKFTARDLFSWALSRGKADVPLCVYVQDDYGMVAQPDVKEDMLETADDVDNPDCMDLLFINVEIVNQIF